LNLFFFTYPLSWTEIGFDKAQLWKVYSIIFLPSVLLVFPYMRRAEKEGRFRRPIMLGWLSATVGYAVYLFGAQIELLLYVSGAAFFFRLQHLSTDPAGVSDPASSRRRPRYG
jgi:hypothetical protein